MRKIMFAFILTSLFSMPTHAAEQTVTIVGDEGYVPYMYKDGGQAKGIYVDILKAASARLEGYDIKMKLLPWKRALAEVENGTELAISPPYYRPKARPYMEPYSEPIMAEEVVVVCNEKSASKLKGVSFPKGYAGRTFGNNSGYESGGKEFMDMTKSGAIKLHEAKTTASNLKKMVLGRVDCYINDRIAIKMAVKVAGIDGAKVVEIMTISSENIYVGFSKSGWGKFPYASDFLAKLNATLQAMKDAGEIKAIVENVIGK